MGVGHASGCNAGAHILNFSPRMPSQDANNAAVLDTVEPPKPWSTGLWISMQYPTLLMFTPQSTAAMYLILSWF